MSYVMAPDIDLNGIAVWFELHGGAYKHFLHLRRVETVLLVKAVKPDGDIVSCTVYVQGPGSDPMSHYRVQRFYADGFYDQNIAAEVWTVLAEGCARYAAQSHAQMLYLTSMAGKEQHGGS